MCVATLCIHSVVVDERCRGNKVGTRMLKEYMHHVASHQANVELVLLLCKANLKPFYGSCGTIPPPKAHWAVLVRWNTAS